MREAKPDLEVFKNQAFSEFRLMLDVEMETATLTWIDHIKLVETEDSVLHLMWGRSNYKAIHSEQIRLQRSLYCLQEP